MAGDSAGNGSGKLRRYVAVTRSGLARYPRHILQSFNERNGVAGPGAGTGPLKALPAGEDHELAVSWLGHATVLLRMGGKWVLTDPVMSHRIGPRIGNVTFGLARSAPCPVEVEDLPALDVALISHAHFDHLDKPTLRKLPRENVTAVTARGTGRLLPRGFSKVTELDWGGRAELGSLTVSALRPRHWGARTALDRKRGFNSYLIESENHRVLFAGDTAMTDAFDGIPHATLAIFGIGAYGLWDNAHATPEQVWTMFKACGADYLMPVHHSTFPMGDEAPDEPMRRLMEAAGSEGHRVVGSAAGEVWRPGSASQATEQRSDGVTE